MIFFTKILKYNLSFALKTPLKIQLIKTNEGVAQLRKSLAARFRDQSIINETLNNYQFYKKSLFEFEGISKQINEINKQMKSYFKNNNQQQIIISKQKISELKRQQTQKEEAIKKYKNIVESAFMKIGNIVHPDVTIAQDQNLNPILKQHKDLIGKFNKVNKSYQELNEMFNFSDLKRGQKVSGHRGYFLTGNGVKLALGLAHYGVTFLEEKGYKIYQTPALILQQILKECCQLQSIDTDMYKISDSNLILIATSEQSLAGYYRGQTLQEKSLPISMGGYSSCFRKEAGAHGKDIHGLFRVHQFQKVEQFVICKQSESQNQMKRMMEVSQQFYQSLNIPYRVVDIVSGELNDTAVRKYDLEGWYPSQKRYRELVSVSNCTDYQSRLLDIKYRHNAENVYPHMLNGTLVAIQRTITCLLQNLYNSDEGVLEIPVPLQKYMGSDRLSKKL